MNTTEWIEELRKLFATPEDAVSQKDICRVTGCSKAAIQERIREGIESGLIRFAGRRQEYRVDGVLTRVPVYQIGGTKCDKNKKRSR